MGSSTEASAVQKPTRNPWDIDARARAAAPAAARPPSRRACVAASPWHRHRRARSGSRPRLCGVVGLKPTYGRVSRYGVIAYASSLDQVGPLARSVEDAALLLEVIAGHDRSGRDLARRADPPSYRDAVADGRDIVQGLRVGLPREYYAGDGLDPEMSRRPRAHRRTPSVERGAAARRALAAAHGPRAGPRTTSIAPAEASSNLARYDGIRYGKRAAERRGDLPRRSTRRRAAQGFGPEVKRRIMLGTYALRAGYYDAYYKKAAAGARARSSATSTRRGPARRRAC